MNDGPVVKAGDRPIGLFTSLPILWAEQDGVAGMLADSAPPHWVRTVLEQRGPVVALDTLNDPALSRAGTDRLVMAQPRALSPDENVALDGWVRAGGRVLIFADPMLTQDSAFALGDRRRPQDVVLLSPILARWGLQLRFDDMQQHGERESAGEGVPVNLPGTLSFLAGGHDARCRMGPEALVARCAIGKGYAMIVADAALLEQAGDADSRRPRLDALLDQAFPG
ncbi:ABC transporter [Novosphingobium sp. SL115]|uniref:DUF4350 domain-containing protein n=1 Tax=Novosphingobium sp. SL115 TaxID=2995150 RepID=UPI0022746068|nr:DUF4350 domain-containing protein [Novosphingobium sp. SL115]MCY1672340.1 ABC transporter [Novosphingobium sp. SL115]